MQTIIEMAKSNNNVLDYEEGRKIKVELAKTDRAKGRKEEEEEGGWKR